MDSIVNNDLDFDTDFNCTYIDHDEFSKKYHNNSRFSLIHYNARSLRRNFDSINNDLTLLKYSFSVIGITETWMTDNNSLFSLDGYTLYSSNRLSGRGGGVALFVRDHLTVSILENIAFHTQGVESLFINIQHQNNRNIIIGVIYRNPSGNVTDFIYELDSIMETTCKTTRYCYIMGDLNINLLKYDTQLYVQSFLDSINSYGLFPIIDKPTRVTKDCATLIDNVFTNVINENSSSSILLSDVSDHFPIFHIAEFNMPLNNISRPTRILYRDITPSALID